MKTARIALLAAAAAAAGLALPATASATTTASPAGPSIHYLSGATHHHIANPVAGHCYDLGAGVTRIHNNTGRPLGVYAGATCAGHQTQLAAGQASAHLPRTVSVMVGPATGTR